MLWLCVTVRLLRICFSGFLVVGSNFLKSLYRDWVLGVECCIGCWVMLCTNVAFVVWLLGNSKSRTTALLTSPTPASCHHPTRLLADLTWRSQRVPRLLHAQRPPPTTHHHRRTGCARGLCHHRIHSMRAQCHHLLPLAASCKQNLIERMRYAPHGPIHCVDRRY